jgi:integrase
VRGLSVFLVSLDELRAGLVAAEGCGNLPTDSGAIPARIVRQLRHYSATELLTAGVDLRTVAGRLGHGDGTNTLRHYVAWALSADQHAAKTIGSPDAATSNAPPH